ncbi:2584_t:CDS:2 [Funneliformis caledonium]|uniref:2584_t:CDS:1 n=1 Tax=Funneliformis caledonium TaxID=1117310 RepID=A0A9N8ZD97_9GLOM|nr:2584_t:CDS:2 [Funneliformis caledonium]
MASVEVKYGQISRKITIDYTQFLSNQESFGGNVKFNVYTADYPDNNSWVLEVLEDAEVKEEFIATSIDANTSFKKDDYIFDEPSMDPSVLKDNNYERQEELLIPVFPANEQSQKIPSNNVENQSSTSLDENVNE